MQKVNYYFMRIIIILREFLIMKSVAILIIL